MYMYFLEYMIHSHMESIANIEYYRIMKSYFGLNSIPINLHHKVLVYITVLVIKYPSL